MNRSRQRAFTIWDLLICIAAVGMLGIYLRTLARPKVRSCHANCVSNLKQIGLGFRMWSNDHGELFPWNVPIADGGTKELAHLPEAAAHYLAVSNELNSPRILKCPEDTRRTKSTRWDSPLHLSLSYFVGLNANETKPATILAGDRNVSTNSAQTAGFLTVQDLSQFQVTPGLHQTYVNVGLADGSVAQLKPADLRRVAAAEMKELTNQTVRLVIP